MSRRARYPAEGKTEHALSFKVDFPVNGASRILVVLVQTEMMLKLNPNA